jgi:hypothetical protein
MYAMISRVIIIVIICLSMASTLARSATIYIDPTCGSSGDGTTTTCGVNGPFKTWAEVTWTVGNTYAQKGGTTAYEYITVGATGTAGNVITLTSYGTGRATIDGSVTISSGAWTGPDGNGVYKIPSTFSGTGIYEDDVPLVYASSAACGNGNTFWGGGYNWYKPTSGTPANHTVQYMREAPNTPARGIALGSNNYITINNLALRRWFIGIGSTEAVTPSGTHNDHIVVTNCTVDDCIIGIGIAGYNATSSNITITNNTVSYCSDGIELSDATADTNGGTTHFTASEIANNTITYCGQAKNTSGLWPSYTTTGPDMEGIGTQTLDTSNIHNNTITGNCRAVVIYAGDYHSSHDVNLYNNFLNTTHLVLQFGLTTASTTAWYNNSAYYNIIKGGSGDLSGGIYAVYLTGASGTSQTNKFYNNTVIADTTGYAVIGTRLDYWDIKNNLIYNTQRLSMGFGSHIDPVTIDYNLYYPNTGIGVQFLYDGVWKLWSDWRAYGYDAYAQSNVDPLFTNASGTYALASDFTLQAGSPAINAGTNVGLTTDYAGCSVHNPPSMGAFEFGTCPTCVGCISNGAVRRSN